LFIWFLAPDGDLPAVYGDQQQALTPRMVYALNSTTNMLNAAGGVLKPPPSGLTDARGGFEREITFSEYHPAVGGMARGSSRLLWLIFV
jgi:hypothetical protein